MATNIDDVEIAERMARISDVDQELIEAAMPIGGYENMPLVPLDIAVEPLISRLPGIEKHANTAKQRCQNPPADGLTIDESASIILYTMGWTPHTACLYFVLNETLRSKSRAELEPWLLYLKLFLTALSRLPSVRQHVYRGVQRDFLNHYLGKKVVTWWGFSSCTLSINVLQSPLFFGTQSTRTLFNIDCYSGKDIQKHSYFRKEAEILLLAATQFEVVGYLNASDGVNIIQLKEINPTVPLLQPVQLVEIKPLAPFLKPVLSNKKYAGRNVRFFTILFQSISNF